MQRAWTSSKTDWIQSRALVLEGKSTSYKKGMAVVIYNTTAMPIERFDVQEPLAGNLRRPDPRNGWLARPSRDDHVRLREPGGYEQVACETNATKSARPLRVRPWGNLDHPCRSPQIEKSLVVTSGIRLEPEVCHRRPSTAVAPSHSCIGSGVLSCMSCTKMRPIRGEATR